MKIIWTITLFLFCNLSFSQKKVDNLPDSLNPKEIRIVKTYNLGEEDVLRIFKDSNYHWRYEFYSSDSKATDVKKDGNLAKNDRDEEKFWAKILMTEIQNVSDYREVAYKFKLNKHLVFIDKGWGVFYDHLFISFDVAYRISIRDKEKFNEVIYANPDRVLDTYPDVDELIIVVDLLNLIRSEFGIWEKVGADKYGKGN